MGSENVEGESVSGGMVGRNGAFGAFEACGSRLSYARALVQISGDAWRIRAVHYRELFDQPAGLRIAIHKHIEALLVEARQPRQEKRTVGKEGGSTGRTGGQAYH